MEDTRTPAEKFVDFCAEREDEKAAGLPDIPANHLIKRLVDERLVWVDVERLQNLQRLALSYEGQAGAFVECGVAKGGSLAMMAAYAGDRTVWGFDSFEALPELTPEDGGSGSHFVGVKCSGPQGEAAVPDTFRRAGVAMDRVRVVKGWFSDTLPAVKAEIGPIAILRVDADWYEASRYVLEALYAQVIPGGVVLIDDYDSFAGCRRAVDEFRAGVECGVLLHTEGSVEAFWFV